MSISLGMGYAIMAAVMIIGSILIYQIAKRDISKGLMRLVVYSYALCAAFIVAITIDPALGVFSFAAGLAGTGLGLFFAIVKLDNKKKKSD